MNKFKLAKTIGRLLSPVNGTGVMEIDLLLEQDELWPELLRVAGDGFVTTSLARELERKDLFNSLPEEFSNYLNAIRQLNTERNEILKTELFSIIARLNEINVRPLLLKGAISLVTDQYPGCENRVVGDLDVAVPVERIEECFHLLARNPYRAELEFGQKYELNEHHHAPPLLHKHLPVTVELHRQVLRKRFDDLLPTDEVWRNSLLQDGDGLLFRLPDPTDRLMHTFVHTQIQDLHHLRRRIVLRPLCEFVHQRASFANEINWKLIKQRLGRKHRWKLEVYLLAARELFGQELPTEVKSGLRAKLRMISIRACTNSPLLFKIYYHTRRLKRLPRRLLTPSWYMGKLKAVKRGESI